MNKMMIKTGNNTCVVSREDKIPLRDKLNIMYRRGWRAYAYDSLVDKQLLKMRNLMWQEDWDHGILFVKTNESKSRLQSGI